MNVLTTPKMPTLETLQDLRYSAMSAWADLPYTDSPSASDTLWKLYTGMDVIIQDMLGLTPLGRPVNPKSLV